MPRLHVSHAFDGSPGPRFQTSLFMAIEIDAIVAADDDRIARWRARKHAGLVSAPGFAVIGRRHDEPPADIRERHFMAVAGDGDVGD